MTSVAMTAIVCGKKCTTLLAYVTPTGQAWREYEKKAR